MTLTRRRIENLVLRIQGAFLENPSLALTVPGAEDRFGIDDGTCTGVLGALVDAGVLTERDGTYHRRFPRPAAPRAA